MKRLVLLLIVLISVGAYFFLSSDSVVPVLSEEDVIREFSASFSLFADSTVNEYSVTVEKRRTQYEEGTDSIYLSVKASTEEYTYSGSFIQNYVLYNDGWKFEESIIESQLYTPKCTVNPSLISKEMEKYAKYGSIEKEHHIGNLEKGVDSYSFTAIYNGKAFRITTSITLTYKWNYDIGLWNLNDTIITPSLGFPSLNQEYLPLEYTVGTKPNQIIWNNSQELHLDYNNIFPSSYFANRCDIIIHGGSDPVYRVYVYDQHKVAYSIDFDSILSSGYIELNIYPGFFFSDWLYIY